MEVSLTSKVTREVFFQVISDSIVDDINQNTNKNISPELLKKGFKFSKTLVSNQKASCTILEFKKDEIISIQYKNDKMLSVITYTFLPHDDGSEIRFASENFRPNGKEISVMFGLKHQAKRKMVERLKQVEAYALDKMKGQSTD